MSSSQIVYLCAVGVYVLFFLLFARFFIWKHYADTRYWKRRPALSRESVRKLAAEKGLPVPRFSIIVPARNEAEVIGRTIDHLLTLDYDPDRFEIIIASDEKEALARDRRRVAVLAEATGLVAEQARSGGSAVRPAVSSAPVPRPRPLRAQPRATEAEEVVLGVLARFAVCDYSAGRREYRRLTLHLTHEMGEPELVGPLSRHVAAVQTLARRLFFERRPLNLTDIRRVARLAAPTPDRHQTDLAAAVHLALAVPVAVAFGLVTRRADSGDPAEVVSRTGQAREEVTARILTVMAGVIARSLAQRLAAERAAGRLGQLLGDAYNLRFATTQDVVEERIAALAAAEGAEAGSAGTLTAARLAAGGLTAGALSAGAVAAVGGARATAAAAAPGQTRRFPVVKHVVVPADFDGLYPGRRIGREVPSTKGRALNWALSHTDPRSEVYGFYDAESRPDRRVLLYVAARRLSGDPSARLLQGPAFQVRNFFRMGAFCKVACLYQAIAHDWYLPALFRKLPFVGGTNLFIDRALLERAGGFDAGSLTEDLELGVRAYLDCDAWPEFLPYPSSEQTPPTLVGFFRQRLRWGAGHLQVMDKIRASSDRSQPKVRGILRTLWLKGQFEWVLYQLATLIPPAVIILNATGHVDASVLPRAVRVALGLVSLIYPCFTFYAYYRYHRFIDPLDRDPGIGTQVWVLLQLLILPLAAFCFPIPYTAALILKAIGREPRTWVKTPRTAE